MIWGGADVITIEIKCMINIMHLNHPEIIPPKLGPWKKCLPWSWSLVPKRLRTTSLNNRHLSEFQRLGRSTSRRQHAGSLVRACRQLLSCCVLIWQRRSKPCVLSSSYKGITFIRGPNPWSYLVHCHCATSKSCLTLCNSMDCSMPGFLVSTISIVFSSSRTLSWWCYITMISSNPI